MLLVVGRPLDHLELFGVRVVEIEVEPLLLGPLDREPDLATVPATEPPQNDDRVVVDRREQLAERNPTALRTIARSAIDTRFGAIVNSSPLTRNARIPFAAFTSSAAAAVPGPPGVGA